MNIPETHIAWHCRSCGHNQEERRLSGSYPVNCSECGKPEVQRYHKNLPTNRVWCDSSPQRYDLCSNKREIQVYLRSMDGKAAGLTFDPDEVPDCDQDALDVAKEVLSAVQKYLYSSSLPKIKETVAAMEACHEASEKNRTINRRNEIRRELAELQREWNNLEDE